MKKFTALFLLMFALALNANADNKNASNIKAQFKYQKALPAIEADQLMIPTQNKDSKTQAKPIFKWVADYRITANPFELRLNLFEMDPVSKNSYFITSTNDNNSKGKIASSDTLHILKPGASTYVRQVLSKLDDEYLFQYPSLAVLEAKEVANETRLAVLSINYDKVSLSSSGAMLYLKDGIDALYNPLLKPMSNNTSAQDVTFSTGPIVPFTGNGQSVVHIAQMLDVPSNNNFNFGNYGYVGFDFAQGFTNNALPEQWSASLFRGRDNAGTGGYGSDIQVDTDNDGNVYAAITNLFTDNLESRAIAYSKSTDNGKTWASFNKTTPELLTNYAISQGFETAGFPNQLAYGQNGFIVTGTDEFSYVLNVVLFRGTGATAESQYQLVEVFRKEGNYGVRKLTDLDDNNFITINRSGTFFPNSFTYLKPDYTRWDGSTQPKLLLRRDIHDRGHEIELAKTLDGQHLIAKWIHNRNQKVPINTDGSTYGIIDNITDEQGNETNNATVMLDSVPVTDIYVSYRATSGGNWSNPINITDDEVHDFLTAMPKYHESINSIKISKYENFVPLAHSTTLPSRLTAKISSYAGRIFMADFDLLTTGVEVDQAPTTYNFNLYDVAPNPATEQTNISYSLNTAALVNLEVFDAMGNKVATLFNGNLSEGFYATPYDVTALASGAYFYSLTVNGVTLTKTLNVVK